jgi:hypothetical protein
MSNLLENLDCILNTDYIYVFGIFLPINSGSFVKFEDFTAVTMKNGVFWDVTLCGSCKNRRFGGT